MAANGLFNGPDFRQGTSITGSSISTRQSTSETWMKLSPRVQGMRGSPPQPPFLRSGRQFSYSPPPAEAHKPMFIGRADMDQCPIDGEITFPKEPRHFREKAGNKIGPAAVDGAAHRSPGKERKVLKMNLHARFAKSVRTQHEEVNDRHILKPGSTLDQGPA